jgi:hypothetical protein
MICRCGTVHGRAVSCMVVRYRAWSCGTLHVMTSQLGKLASPESIPRIDSEGVITIEYPADASSPPCRGNYRRSSKIIFTCLPGTLGAPVFLEESDTCQYVTTQHVTAPPHPACSHALCRCVCIVILPRLGRPCRCDSHPPRGCAEYFFRHLLCPRVLWPSRYPDLNIGSPSCPCRHLSCQFQL